MKGTLAELLSPTPDIPIDDSTVAVESIDEIPLDPAPTAEGDNTLLEGSGGKGLVGLIDAEKLTATKAKPAKAIWVPLYRTLRSGKRGRDVVALQRALKRIGLRKTRATGFYGRGTAKQVKALQKRAGIGAKTGEYGPKSHTALLRMGGYDAYGAWLMQNGPAAPTDARTRTAIISAALYFYAIRDRVHYTQTAKRMQIVREKIKTIPLPVVKEIWEDCSSFFTGLYYIGGAPDPNGRHYDGLGYTGTLASEGMQLPSPRRASAAFYGPGMPYKHVTVSLGNGRCISHGSEGGPYHLEDRYRPDFSHYRDYPMEDT